MSFIIETSYFTLLQYASIPIKNMSYDKSIQFIWILNNLNNIYNILIEIK